MNMLEKIKEALQDEIVCGREDFSDADTIDYNLLATRVLLAMRDPTDEMYEAATEAHYGGGWNDGINPIHVWQAMIDAATGKINA